MLSLRNLGKAIVQMNYLYRNGCNALSNANQLTPEMTISLKAHESSLKEIQDSEGTLLQSQRQIGMSTHEFFQLSLSVLVSMHSQLPGEVVNYPNQLTLIVSRPAAEELMRAHRKEKSGTLKALSTIFVNFKQLNGLVCSNRSS